MPDDVVAHIAEQVRELARLAAEAERPFLVYLLAMAEMEARGPAPLAANDA